MGGWYYKMLRDNNSIDRSQALYESPALAIWFFNQQNGSVISAGGRHNKTFLNVS